MKKLFFLLTISVFLFSCIPDGVVVPETVLSPPQWFVGNWSHSDSSGVIEKVTVNENNVTVENFDDNISINYKDYFNRNKMEVKEMINHNISYGFEYLEDNEMKLINFAVIGNNEVRFVDENGPTHKTYIKE